ncbi:MAG: 16S rRNA (cytidine1402-2'-O)-methyltransferase [Polyangiales bacterium]
MSASAPHGELCVVATPIGHLDDITLRALNTLRGADLILAEDTRRTRILLDHHGIRKPLRAHHAHSPPEQLVAIVERIAGGERIALVSDAGTPLVSDPGAQLVCAVRDAGLHVTTAPGASAVLAALSIAGLRSDRFRFVGFMPRQGKRRRMAIEGVVSSTEASVVFESPRRIAALLRDLSEHLGSRRLAVCRELTKLHEEVVRGTAAELAEVFAEGARGEITLVVEAVDEGTKSPLDAPFDIDDAVTNGLAAGIHPRALAKEIAAEAGISGGEAYDLVLAAKKST